MPRRSFLKIGTSAAAGLVLAPQVFAAETRRVVVWSEHTAPKDVYPKDINTAIADALKPLPGWEVVVASIDDPEQGCSEESLNKTDVLIWWGHKRHDEVKDKYVDLIEKRVKQEGMGFIALHSSHFARPNKRLMGTACSWAEYKVDGTSVDIVVKEPHHPIAEGVKDFKLPAIEVYGEPYAVPKPEAVVFEGVYHRPDGRMEKARMGICWTIGKGKFFYFTPGHETFRDFYDPSVIRLLQNAVRWAAPQK